MVRKSLIKDSMGLSVVIFILTLISYSDTTKALEGDEIWMKGYGGTNYDNFSSMDKTDDGGYIAVGRTSSNNGDFPNNKGLNDFSLTKLDQNGNKEWIQVYGGSNEDFMMEVKQTSDDGYVAAGYSYSNNGDIPGNIRHQDFIIAKFDSLGNKEWIKNYGGVGTDILTSVLQLPNGDYMAVGHTFSNSGPDIKITKGGMDGVLARFDSNGNKLWMKAIGGSGDDYINGSILTKDGNIVIMADSNSPNGDLIGSHGSSDMVIAKYDFDGNQIWQKNYGGSKSDMLSEITETSDGGFIAAGYTTSTDGDIGPGKGSYDAILLKLDSNGDKEWVKGIGGSGTDLFYSVFETLDGRFVASGYSTSVDGDIPPGLKGVTDLLIAKFEASGQKVWVKTAGGSGNEHLSEGRIDHNGDYVFIGTTNSTEISGKGLYDALFVKFEGDHTSPSEVSNLVEEHTNTGIKLNWVNPVEYDFNKTKIYRDDVLIKESDEEFITDSELLEGKEYTYKIVTVDQLGNESVGRIIKVTTDNITPPDNPLNIQAIGTDGTIVISWDENSEIDLAGYNVYIDGQKLNEELVVENTYKIHGLENGQTYKVNVTSVDIANNESQNEEGVDVLVKDTIAPDTPIITFFELNNGKLKLNFERNAATDFWGFNLYINNVLFNYDVIRDLEYSLVLLPGIHNIAVTALDLFMNESLFSSPLTITLNEEVQNENEEDNTEQEVPEEQQDPVKNPELPKPIEPKPVPVEPIPVPVQPKPLEPKPEQPKNDNVKVEPPLDEGEKNKSNEDKIVDKPKQNDATKEKKEKVSKEDKKKEEKSDKNDKDENNLNKDSEIENPKNDEQKKNGSNISSEDSDEKESNVPAKEESQKEDEKEEKPKPINFLLPSIIISVISLGFALYQIIRLRKI